MLHRATFLTLLGALVAAAPASAAYAPKLTAKIDPSTPMAAAAITTTITQKPGETPNKTVRVGFPVGFSANILAKPGICSADDEAKRACPPDTQIGKAAATANVLGLPIELAGTVHYGGANASGIKLIVFLHNDLAGDQTIEGYVRFRDDGGFDAIFDGLPDTLTTSFTLALDGGDKALSLTPKDCGSYTFKASFTSQKGEQASGDAAIDVTGCKPTKLDVLNLALSRTGTVTFNLTAVSNGSVTVSRGGKRVFKQAFTGHEGVNKVKSRRKLKAGTYKVTVGSVTPDGQSVRKQRTIRLR